MCSPKIYCEAIIEYVLEFFDKEVLRALFKTRNNRLDYTKYDPLGHYRWPMQ
jgi:hypothetical protein